MLEWYVAKTQPHKERLAERNLANQGIKSFLPRLRTTRRRFNTFEDRLVPLFPGYIFFRSDRDPALWRAVSGTVGLKYVIWGDGRVPRAVPFEVMDELIATHNAGALSPFAIAPGDTVTISRGPFTGFFAKVCALKPRGRIELLLEVMGGASLTIERDAVHHI